MKSEVKSLNIIAIVLAGVLVFLLCIFIAEQILLKHKTIQTNLNKERTMEQIQGLVNSTRN